MKVAISQPSYIPWRGYFHQIQKVDVFVFFDTVQYTRRSWRNRNRVRGEGDAHWLTIPVHSKGLHENRTQIRCIDIDWARKWNVSHRRSLAQFYRRAPFYARYEAMLDDIYSRRPERLADFTIDLTIDLARKLGIQHTRFVRASELEVSGQKTELVLSILRAAGATHFVNGPTAKAYTDEQLLLDAGLSLEYMDYDYPEYPQLGQPFDPHLSVLDLLFMVGPDAPRYVWDA